MNDPSNLSLHDELVRFQADKLTPEIRFVVSNVDKLRQRTLQSLAHSLDLNYEYSLRAQEVRITRSDVPMSLEANILESNVNRPIGFQGSSIDAFFSCPNDDDTMMFSRQPLSASIHPGDFLTCSDVEGPDFSINDLHMEDLDFSSNDLPMEGTDWDLTFGEQQTGDNATTLFGSEESIRIPDCVTQAFSNSMERLSLPENFAGGSMGADTDLRAGSGPLRHPRPLIAADLRLQLEEEQEAEVS